MHDVTVRKVGMGSLASGCVVTVIGFGQIIGGFVPAGSMMAEAAWPLLIIGQLIATGGTIIYWWASDGGKPWQMEMDAVVAMVPIVGPLLILTHTVLRERDACSPLALQTHRALSILLIGALVFVARCS